MSESDPFQNGEGDRSRRLWWRGPTTDAPLRFPRAPSVSASRRHLPVPGRSVLALIAFLLPSPAAAWWEYGHQTIARIAMHEASPPARAATLRLLRRSHLLDTPACPARTPAQASVWADCVRALGDRFSFTAPWHYQNVDVCRPFDPTAACANGNCVSAQIDRNLRLLKDRSLPERERVAALAFLIHFVGDLHMPLHAGDRGDRGGNDVRAFYGQQRSNLHAIWDGYLAERSISTPPAGSRGLLAELTPAERTGAAAGTTIDWARESWEVSRTIAYPSLLPNPCGARPSEPPRLIQARLPALIPIVRRQVARAGLRLARLLDEALA